MYEIAVTFNSSKKPKEFFELIMEVARRQEKEIIIDEKFSFTFLENQFQFIFEELKSKGNRLFFNLPNNLDISDIAMSYGKFVSLLLSSSLWFDKKGDLIKDRQPDIDKGDEIFRFADYVNSVWINKVKENKK